MTVIAVPQAPPIICPSWCVVSHQEHIDELPGADGFVIHWAHEVRIVNGTLVSLQQITYPDGTPKDGDPVTAWIDDLPADGLELADAAEFAQGLLQLIEAAQR